MNQVLTEKKIVPTSKYGFGKMSVGEQVVIEGDKTLIRISADGFRKRWGMMFLVEETEDSKVKIKRFK